MKSMLFASTAFVVAGILASPAAFAQMTTPTAPSAGTYAQGYGTQPTSPPGYPNGQPVAPASKPHSSQPSSATMPSAGTSAQDTGTQPTSPPGYPNGQPVAPASKPNYSRP